MYTFILPRTFHVLAFLLSISWTAPAFAKPDAKFPVQVREQIFQAVEILSRSGRSMIYLLEDGRVLRTFKSSKAIDEALAFVKAYDLLVAHGVDQVARIIESGPGYVVQQYYSGQLDFHYFWTHAEEIKKNSPRRFSHMVRALRRFAQSTIDFAEIGDFHEGQLLWTGRKWVLLDWNLLHQWIKNDADRDHTFLGLMTLTPATQRIFAQLDKDILRARAQRGCERLLTAP